MNWDARDKIEHDRLHRESSGGCASGLFTLLTAIVAFWFVMMMVSTARTSIECRFYAITEQVETRHDGGPVNLYNPQSCEVLQPDGSWKTLRHTLRDGVQ